MEYPLKRYYTYKFYLDKNNDKLVGYYDINTRKIICLSIPIHEIININKYYIIEQLWEEKYNKVYKDYIINKIQETESDIISFRNNMLYDRAEYIKKKVKYLQYLTIELHKVIL